jgi:pimeloyl-ACP methyl ester carboxylesterase
LLARRWFGDESTSRAPIVLLHEGLGSVSAWGDFPDRLAAATVRPVLAFDRAGYGNSAPNPPPWPASFMHDEAKALAALLEEEGIDRPLLVGHSDGATIALLYPALGVPAGGPPPLGIVSISAHAFVEPVCVREIGKLRSSFDTTLAPGLRRHHDRAEDVFEGWSEVWVSERFRTWSIDDELSAVTCPTVVIQGTNDTYSDGGQLERITMGIAGPFETYALRCDHWPHREEPGTVIAATIALCDRVDPQ